MKIITLIEDTPGLQGLHAEHGLCFYIETQKHHLLVDTGQSPKTWENASALGVDLNSVDTVILSHGHYDHSGGIASFAAVNPHAKIYMQRSAGADYYHTKSDGRHYIGIDKAVLALPQVVLLDGDLQIDEELSLFTDIRGRNLWPAGNRALCKKSDDGSDTFVPDDFVHEQCLVIREGGRTVLLSGCAHNGILNILEKYRTLYGSDPDYVFSGFHMMQKDGYTEADISDIQKTAEILSKGNAIYYTGHCTGMEAFELMKPILGEKLRHIYPGYTVE